MKKVGPTLPPPAVVFFSPVLLSSVSLTKGSRRQKQTEVLFANPGEEEKFPSRDKETVVKKGVVCKICFFFLPTSVLLYRAFR